MNSFKKKALRFGAMAVAAVAVFATLPVSSAIANDREEKCKERPGCYFGNGIDPVKGVKVEAGEHAYMRICYFSPCGNRVRVKVRADGPFKVKMMPDNWMPGDDVMVLGGDHNGDGGNGGQYPPSYTECKWVKIETREGRHGDGRLKVEVQDRDNNKKHRASLRVWVRECVEAPDAWASTYHVSVEPGVAAHSFRLLLDIREMV